MEQYVLAVRNEQSAEHINSYAIEVAKCMKDLDCKRKARKKGEKEESLDSTPQRKAWLTFLRQTVDALKVTPYHIFVIMKLIFVTFIHFACYVSF